MNANLNQLFAQAPPASRKRIMMPTELFGKFSAKSDFIKYFRDSFQLYLPPEYMMYVAPLSHFGIV